MQAEKSNLYDKRILSAEIFFMMVKYYTKKKIIRRCLKVKNDQFEFKSSNKVTYIQNIDLK